MVLGEIIKILEILISCVNFTPPIDSLTLFFENDLPSHSPMCVHKKIYSKSVNDSTTDEFIWPRFKVCRIKF